MGTTEQLRESLIVLMEAALEGGSGSMLWDMELTITSIPARRSMPNITRSFRLESLSPLDLLSTLQSLHASSAPTSSGTQE